MKEWFIDISEKLQDAYTYLYEERKTLKKYLLIAFIIITIYQGIDSYINYDFHYFFIKELIISAYTIGLILIVRAFHSLFGKWFIHRSKYRLTRQFVKEKLPRSIKFEGYTGIGKDSTVNALRKVFQEDIEEYITEELESCQLICYIYDFEKIDSFIDKNHEAFDVSSKTEFFEIFKESMEKNNCFIKDYYLKKDNFESHLKELYEMKKDQYSKDFEKYEFKFNNGINRKHFLTLLIRYFMLYMRINYIKGFVMENQPSLEKEGIGAKMFSTDFTNIQTTSSNWVWPLDGNVIVIETESDAFYPNVGLAKNQKPMKTGLRNFKAIWRHPFGEKSVWFNIGQKASRTEKSLRELDHAFISVIEKSSIYGGEKRIYFILKRLSWVNFWASHSLTTKGKEKHIRRRSLLHQKISRLLNTGYAYLDLIVSRTDYFTQAEEMSLKKALRHDKKIYENYKIKLCFKLYDCYFGYNTTYLESIAEMLARRSKTKWSDVRSWDLDLILKRSHIKYMNYPVLNEIVKEQPKKDGAKK